MTLTLGIDPGTASTGYGLVRQAVDGNLSCLEYGILSTPKDLTAAARLSSLFDQMGSLIEKFSPDTAAIERLFFQRNISTAIAVGQARGVVLLALQRAGINMFEYTPTAVKQAVAGYGAADKRQVQEMVRTLLQLNSIPKPDDAADALAIAITHLHTQRY